MLTCRMCVSYRTRRTIITWLECLRTKQKPFSPLRAEKALFSRAMTGHKGLFSARSEREEKTFFPPFLDFFQPIARKRVFFPPAAEKQYSKLGLRPILAGGKTDKKATKKQQFVDCFCLDLDALVQFLYNSGFCSTNYFCQNKTWVFVQI